jgi:hypothetical protein
MLALNSKGDAMDDQEKYILEQANIEVEYTRSWPNQLLAFYVAINFGVSGAFLAFANGVNSAISVPDYMKVLLTLGVAVMCIWTIRLLIKNHLSYLVYRNVQIAFQKKHLEVHKTEYSLPSSWFRPNKINIRERGLGWGFYGFTVVLVTVITFVTIWEKCLLS